MEKVMKEEETFSGDVLLRDFIVEILKLTSPRDSCRMSLVSSTFQLAADSNPLWEKFLPREYSEILPRALTPVQYFSMKELYFTLCNSIYIDNSYMSFSLERLTGKMCYSLAPRGLRVIWIEDPRYWRHVSHPGSRFPEVAELLDVCWLEIDGTMNNVILSPGTTYAVYFIFKLNEDSYGLDFPSQETLVKVGTQISEHNVCLQPTTLEEMEEGTRTPRLRDDGWMEIEMGDFFNNNGVATNVYLSFRHVKVMNWKRGLVFERIELRPQS